MKNENGSGIKYSKYDEWHAVASRHSEQSMAGAPPGPNRLRRRKKEAVCSREGKPLADDEFLLLKIN